MWQKLAIALGGGIAAALLFAVTATGTVEGIFLAYLAPLPLMIVAIGWGLSYGAAGGAIAIAAVAMFAGPLSAAIYAATLPLPAWLLACAAIRQPGAALRRLVPATGPGQTPAGALLIVAAAISVVSGLVLLCGILIYYRGFQPGLDALSAVFSANLKEALDQGLALPDGLTEPALAKSVAYYMPAALSAGTTLMLCLNLYAAGRLVQLSQLRPVAWRSLPNSLLLPKWLAIALAASVVLAFTLPEPLAIGALIVAAPLAIAFVLQGLAVIHALTRGFAMRGPMLAGVYMTLFVITRSALATLAGVGLLESFLLFRARAATPPQINPSVKS